MDREDLRSASTQALLAEINRDHAKRSEPFKPTDFFTPRSHAPTVIDTEAEVLKRVRSHKAMVEMLNAAFGGADLRKESEEG